MEPLIHVAHLSRRDPQTGAELLHDLTFSIDAGDSLAITGPTGSGKTLLMRAVTLLDPADSGTILWNGTPIDARNIRQFRRQVIYMHQRPVLFEGTVEDNLRRPFELNIHQDRRFDRERIERHLSEIGRDATFLSKNQAELSGGESQLVALLRAMQLDPSVLLLDEPTAALDRQTIEIVESMVVRWKEDSETTRALVWVSHDPAQIERMAQRKLVLKGGRLQQSL